MKQIICCAMLLISSIAANACDVCGASSGNQNLGLLPQFYRNFAGVQYQYRSFHSTHAEHETGLSPQQSQDQYTTLQVWGRYAIGSRLQVFCFVPYHTNSQVINTTKSTTNGLGDISAIVNYAIVKKADTNGTKHLLLAGVGVKAPTGQYRGVSARDDEGLPNMQPGTGSLDFVANANYTYSHASVGFNTELAYTFTTPNQYDYKYGDRLSAAITGFYNQQVGKVSLMPMAGIKYEYTLHDYDNYTRKWLNEQTGGTMLYGTMGMQAYYKRIGMQVNMDLPLAQHYAGGDVEARYRAGAGILLMF